jgi:hypothetical protein
MCARGAIGAMHGHAANVLWWAFLFETPEGDGRVTRLPGRAPWMRRRTPYWHVIFREDEDGQFVAWVLARGSLARALRALVCGAAPLEF